MSIIAGFGTVQIAANGVANSLDSMGCIVGQAMNLAMITVIGRCVGAGDSGQVRHYTKKIIEDHVCLYVRGKQYHSAVSALDPEMLRIESGDYAAVLHSGHDPQWHGNVFVASIFCTAEHASCLQ